MITEHLAEGVALVFALTVAKVIDHYKGKKRDRSAASGFGEIRDSISRIEGSVAEVRAFCVGPDGKNGFRKDIADLKDGLGREIGEIKERVEGLEERERERLERKAYDRRTGS